MNKNNGSDISISGLLSIIFGVLSLIFFPIVLGLTAIICGLVNFESGFNKVGFWMGVVGSVYGVIVVISWF